MSVFGLLIRCQSSALGVLSPVHRILIISPVFFFILYGLPAIAWATAVYSISCTSTAPWA